MSEGTVQDDLQAVRLIADALRAFEQPEQQRILRWAAEKVGLPTPELIRNASSASATGGIQQGEPLPSARSHSASEKSKQDIKSFLDAKNPRSDVQLAAAVAYYYRFEAPSEERKEFVTKDDLQEACRRAQRDRLGNPYVTLTNAHKLGLLDKGPEKASFVVNTVGENLVAMTLPGEVVKRPKAVRAKSAKRKNVPASKPTLKKVVLSKASGKG